ncbi:MAG: hypothetical protein KIT84_03620 [Labilithrix sp.]|nr:hypothetical protein [Labilithrix sp.]MCW5810072.1 hypothetical protein [Labilithrix sp.]
MVRRILVVAALGVSLFACKEERVLPPPAGDPGTDQPLPPSGSGVGQGDGSSGGSGDDDDAGTCTDLELTGVLVDENAVADDPLPGNGGTIADGIYNLEGAQVLVGGSGLPGPTGTTYRGTIRVSAGGTTFERVLQIGAQSGTPQETRARGSLATIAPNTTITLTCPTTTAEQYSFSATGPTLILTDLAAKRRWSYVLGL